MRGIFEVTCFTQQLLVLELTLRRPMIILEKILKVSHGVYQVWTCIISLSITVYRSFLVYGQLHILVFRWSLRDICRMQCQAILRQTLHRFHFLFNRTGAVHSQKGKKNSNAFHGVNLKGRSDICQFGNSWGWSSVAAVKWLLSHHLIYIHHCLLVCVNKHDMVHCDLVRFRQLSVKNIICWKAIYHYSQPTFVTFVIVS